MRSETWTMSDLVEAICRAIAVVEGFYQPGSVPRRFNNPGDIFPWPGCKLPVDKKSGVIVFPTVADGWTQLRAQVRKNIGRNLTLFEFFAGQRDEKGNLLPGGYAGYCPAPPKKNPTKATKGNNPLKYAQDVGRAIGLAIDVRLFDVIGGMRRVS